MRTNWQGPVLLSMISRSLPSCLIALKGRKDGHPTLWVPDAVPETNQREVNRRAASLVLSSRQDRSLSLYFPQGPIPLPLTYTHAHARTQTHTQSPQISYFQWEEQGWAPCKRAHVGTARWSPGCTQLTWVMPLAHVYKGQCAGGFLIPSGALGGDAEELFCNGPLLICGRQRIVDLFFLNENCLLHFKI